METQKKSKFSELKNGLSRKKKEKERKKERKQYYGDKIENNEFWKNDMNKMFNLIWY